MNEDESIHGEKDAPIVSDIDDKCIFKLPIEYIDNKTILSDTIKEDLHLIEHVRMSNEGDEINEKGNDNDNDNSGNELSNEVPMMTHLLNPQNENEKRQLPRWTKYYTTDETFLTESQELYAKCNEDIFDNDFYNTESYENMVMLNERVTNIQNDQHFYDQYNFVDWSYFRFLNNYSWFLQLLSMYTLSSPLLALCAPILVLFVPFLILKFQGLSISFSTYLSTLFLVLRRNVIGQLFFEFNNVGWDKRIYIVFSAIMYVFQIYQNIQFCFKFRRNIQFIYDTNHTLCKFIERSGKTCDRLLSMTSELNTYKGFNDKVKQHQNVLNEYHKYIKHYSKTKGIFQTFTSMGSLLQLFYQLSVQDDLFDSVKFMVHLEGYVGNVIQLNKQLASEELNKITIGADKYINFKDMYYPAVHKHEVVKNNVKLNKNIIITGPNASGKTTLLKATLLNVVLGHQIGCGYLGHGSSMPLYDTLSCYINIPDTSGRDSLFQSEARRCKEILDSVYENPSKKHFCIFDELYSGTNPYEAISSSYTYLKYMSSLPNVDFMLTTHYIDVCHHLKTHENIRNCSMKTIETDSANDFEYTYKLINEISTIRGGIKVLKDLKYPASMVDETKTFLDKIKLLGTHSTSKSKHKSSNKEKLKEN